MVDYQKAKYKEFIGEYPAVVTEVLVEQNGSYNSEWENSTKQVLTITFELMYEGEMKTFTQNFVSPLTGGSGLFQQLLDAAGVQTDSDEGSVDEQLIIMTPLIITFAKNKKGYDTVKEARLDPKRPTKKKEAKDKNAVVDQETGEVFDS